jgi:hypothetical protein
MIKGTNMTSSLTKLATFAGGMLLAGAAGAVEFDVGGDAALTVSNRISLGATMRMEDPDPDLVGIGNGGRAFSTNGDDGNLAWEKNDIVASALKLTSDISFTFGDYGLFVRGSVLHNAAMENGDLFDPADYQPNAQREQPLSELRAKEKAIRDAVGTDADLLDAYFYGRFDIAGRELLVKTGRQVLNWGESVFVQHGLNALISADVNQLRVPGWEIEEVQKPVGMAVFSFDVVENMGVEAFYQFEWMPTTIDVPGSFWSTNDFAGIGGTQANIGFGRIAENKTASVAADPTTWCLPPPSLAPGFGSPCVPFGSTVPRGANVEPEDGGQFGGKMSFYIPFLNDMDLSLYAANYHSRLPVLSGISRTGPTTSADTAAYLVEYPEDIQLYGLSFNTTWSLVDIAIQGEYSLKRGQPLQLDDVELLLAGLGAAGQISPLAGATLGNQYLRGWRRHDVDQVDLSFTKILGPLAWMGYDQLSMFVESGFVHVRDMPSPRQLAYDAPGTSTLNSGTAALNPATANGLPVVPYEDYADSYSWGYKAAARFTYNNVFNAFTLEPTVLWQHDVRGITPTPIVNFVEDRKQVNLLLGVNYLQAWNFDLGYAMYLGDDPQNLLHDRDYRA